MPTLVRAIHIPESTDSAEFSARLNASLAPLYDHALRDAGGRPLLLDVVYHVGEFGYSAIVLYLEWKPD